MVNKILLFCILIFLPLYAQDKKLFDALIEEKRYSDVMNLILSSSKPLLPWQLRNLSRASLFIGDMDGAFFYSSMAIKREYSLNDSSESFRKNYVMKAYIHLALRNTENWNFTLSKIPQLKPYDHQRFKTLELVEEHKGYLSAKNKEQIRLALQDSSSPQKEAMIDIIDNHEQKRPWLASALNAVVPGSGFAYLGMWQTGTLSFVLCSLSILAAREAFLRKMPYLGTGVSVLGSVFYAGGIFGGYASAIDINKKRLQPLVQDLNQILIPEISFEWEF